MLNRRLILLLSTISGCSFCIADRYTPLILPFPDFTAGPDILIGMSYSLSVM